MSKDLPGKKTEQLLKLHQFLQIMIQKLVKLIADAMEKVGKDGVITVEEGSQLKQHLKLLRVCNLIEVIYHLLYYKFR